MFDRRRLLGQGLARLGGAMLAATWLGPRRAGASRPASPLPAPGAACVKAAYLSYFGVGDRLIRERVFDLADTTELNAIVIDVKGDRGFIPYETRVPLALEAGAVGPVRVRDVEGMLARLRDKGIYTIARVVVFKDDVLARHRPEWALLDARTRRPWRDNEGLAWLDPFRDEAWAYAIAVAQEAALKGFSEIQFDYLRFPSDGALGAIRYARANNQEARLAAIAEFLRRARAQFTGLGVPMAVDVFGYTAFNANDTNVGQRGESGRVRVGAARHSAALMPACLSGARQSQLRSARARAGGRGSSPRSWHQGCARPCSHDAGEPDRRKRRSDEEDPDSD